MATLYSICISPERGQLKKEVAEAKAITDFGIENDGHAGKWSRQVTCLDYGSVQRTNKDHQLNAGPGAFAENLLVEGLDFTKISVGDRLKFGQDMVLEVSRIGKEDHPSVVTRTLGVTLLPYEGLFCRVAAGGTIKKGDEVKLI